MYRLNAVALVLAVTFAQPLSAQHLVDQSQTPPVERLRPPLEVPPAVQQDGMVTRHVTIPVATPHSPDASARHGLGGVIHYLGGAVIGGWVGFVGAQVSHSDWDRGATGELRDQRATWAVAGVALGLLAARIVPSSRPAAVAAPERGFAPPSRDRLATEAIRASGATTAMELIRGLRPEWLVTRGTNSWRETTQGTASGMTGPVVITREGDPTIMVYFNGLRLGGIDKLKDIDTQTLSSVEYFDAHRAVLRFGSSAAHGAILLTTGVDAP